MYLCIYVCRYVCMYVWMDGSGPPFRIPLWGTVSFGSDEQITDKACLGHLKVLLFFASPFIVCM